VTNVKLEYSTNNGTSWSQIVASTAASVGTYAWTIPAATQTSSQCLIKISDVSNLSVNDQSDGVFSIVAVAPTASIRVTSPNGGETLTVGTAQNITWTSSGVTNVKLEYSTNNGTSWSQIIASTPASAGSYAWTIPAATQTSSQCLIKISDASILSMNDQSDAVFSIAAVVPTATIRVTSPNGGETWTVGTTKNVTWTSSSVTNVKIEYSTNNGSTWLTIIASTTASAGSYAWLVPGVTSTQCLVRISDAANAAVNDVSDGVFAISPAGKITVTAPNGGERWPVGISQAITWDYSGVTFVKIEYSTDGGVTWTVIVPSLTASDQTYYWTVSAAVSTTCKIRISDVSNAAVSDYSDIAFTVSPAVSLKLTSPVGGESWIAGSSHAITWEQKNLAALGIFYSIDSGNNWIEIKSGVSAADGSYTWIVPDVSSTTCHVGIVDQDGNIESTSPSSFTIKAAPKPSIQVLSPDGGEQWAVGSTVAITWQAQQTGPLLLQYSNDSGARWVDIKSGVSASDQSYTWTVPNDPSTKCLVRITDPASSLTDMSNGSFSIVAVVTSFITVLSPAPGDRWTVGSTKQITWQFKGVNEVKIELSTDGGVSFPPGQMIADNPPNAASGTFSWIVTNVKSDSCVIKISDRSNSAIYDRSDGFFSIIRPEVTIQHTIPRNVAAENDTITFVALVTGTSEISQVLLYYDENGRRKFDNSVPMTKSGSGGLYIFTLGSGKFTSLGMEYYITARDINNIRANAPPDTGFYNISARVEGMVSPYGVKGGNVQNSYKMISIPLNLEETSITGQLAGTLNGAMGTDWRLFRYNPLKDVPEEYPNIEGFKPGIAFWMITRNDFKLQPPKGTTVTTAEPFSMTLKPGWNDIANPWMFDISWVDMENPSKANLSKPYTYEGGWSDPTNAPKVFNPWTGYAVKNLENRNVVIRLKPKPAGVQKPAAKESTLLWALTLKTSAALAVDNANHLGAGSDASAEWDIHDHVEPPPVGDYVSLTFPHRNWTRYPSDYTVDIRPPEEQLSWDFDVRTNISREKVTVSLEGIEHLPAGLNLTVTDRDTGEKVNIQGSTFDFLSGIGFTERHFTLTAYDSGNAGREDIQKKPVSFVTANSYPNPFNPSTVIRYELSERGKVMVTVFNAVGQKVREYNLGYRERGVHELVFDARGLTSGLYVYHIDAGYASVTEKMLFMK
ncbi:MAG: T9SS type A sorting domain-containing protein, partial [Candidatus Latescibacter sp.]|nr:T9SS type A sorting domain-containing protein [Candidatus Latescibacter sp.]